MNGIFLVKVVRQRARGRQPRRQRDTQSIFRLPRNARREQPDTQAPLAANLEALDALYGSRLAPSHHLMRGQPDAILQWYALAWNRDVGHQDGLFGLPTAMCKMTVATSPLHRPGLASDSCNFFMVHSECWCASAPLNANLSANSLAANTHNGQRPLANMALDFKNQDRWCQRSQYWPTGYALPLWAVDTKYPLPEISTRGVLGVANRTVCLRSGDCLFGDKETTSSTETHRRREHIGDSRTTTPQPHRRSTGSLENRPPVEEHD